MLEIFQVISGSHSYGTNDKKSDIDYYSIVVPEIDCFLGLDNFKSQQRIHNNIDNSITTLKYFVQQAIKGKPQAIEALFVNKEHIIYQGELGKDLIYLREKFLSRKIIYALSGFAYHQYKNCLNGNKDRYNHEIKYDPKAAYHTVRVLLNAVDFKATGDFRTYIKSPSWRLSCKEIKSGLWPKPQVVSLIESLLKQLDETKYHPHIAESSDEDFWNKWLINAHWSVFYESNSRLPIPGDWASKLPETPY